MLDSAYLYAPWSLSVCAVQATDTRHGAYRYALSRILESLVFLAFGENADLHASVNLYVFSLPLQSIYRAAREYCGAKRYATEVAAWTSEV